MEVLLVGAPETLPEGVEELLADQDWTVTRASDVESATAQAREGQVDAVVVAGDGDMLPRCQTFLRSMDTRHIAALVVGLGVDDLELPGNSLVDMAGADVSKEEIGRRLATLSRFQSHLCRVEHEVENMQRLGKRLNQHFREIDEELRLASRLQRDFLPRDMDTVGPLRFATIYRPASWVSGDIFDIQRVDEQHVGCYIADAVGHGLAAGLLTMYVKRAIITKRISDSTYSIIDPGESLQLLNDALSVYTLPNCQFVTASYCLVNIETLTMRYARGGHPYPLLISKDGEVSELKSPGGLMGLFSEFECPTYEVQLQPGDKIIQYTDGIESAFDDPESLSGGGLAGHIALFKSLAKCSGSGMVARIGELLDQERGSLLPADDITVVVMEVTTDS